MNEQFAKEAENWYKENQAYISIMPESKFKEGMKAASIRNRDKIAETGHGAFRAQMQADKDRMLREAQFKDAHERMAKLLEKAKAQELTDEEHKLLMSADKVTVAKYMEIKLRRSGVGKKFYDWTFGTFNVDKDNEKAWQICYDIASFKRTKGIIMSGDTGIGKTHLAVAVAREWIKAGRKVSFANVGDLLDEVKDTFGTNSSAGKIYNRLLDCDLLILDDLGVEKEKNEWVSEQIYKILNRAYQDNKILIATTNLAEYDTSERYNNRINSRFHDMTDWVEYSGKDHRRGFEPSDEPMPFDKQ